MNYLYKSLQFSVEQNPKLCFVLKRHFKSVCLLQKPIYQLILDDCF